MTDETLSAGGLDASPAAHSPTPPAADEPVALPNTNDVQLGQDDGQQPIQDEFEDFEWEGKQVKLPKGMKDGYLRNDDYTRKTQAAAQKERELEAERERIAQQAQASDEHLQTRAQLLHVNSELKKFEQLTWQQWEAWHAEDPVAAEQGDRYFRHLKDQRAGLDGKVKEFTAKQSSEAQAAMAKRFQETSDFAQKNIKGWSPETEAKVVKFARDSGVTDAFMRDNMSPAFIGIMHKAMVGDAALKRASTNPPNPPQTQPLQTVGARTNPGAHKALADMSMDEYVAARKAGRKG